jgi:hypothetical protein
MDEPVAGVRRVELHRRVALVGPEKIVIRPSRRALLQPLIGFLCGAGSFAAIALGLHVLPTFLLLLLLLIAVITIPFAGISLVYSLIGAHVIIDRAKQSATWQQGLSGMGIGTQELVPFWKIAAITVDEAGAAPGATGRPVEELAQWEVALEKQSGKRLVLGGVTAPRPLADEALKRVADLAGAVAALTGAPLRMPEIEEEDEAEQPATHHVQRRRRRTRRTRGRR